MHTRAGTDSLNSNSGTQMARRDDAGSSKNTPLRPQLQEVILIPTRVLEEEVDGGFVVVWAGGKDECLPDWWRYWGSICDSVTGLSFAVSFFFFSFFFSSFRDGNCILVEVFVYS